MVSPSLVLSGISIILLIIYGADAIVGGGGAGDGFLPLDALTRGIGLGMPPIILSFVALSCIGEGNGNPLQYSCLENPRDRGA